MRCPACQEEIPGSPENRENPTEGSVCPACGVKLSGRDVATSATQLADTMLGGSALSQTIPATSVLEAVKPIEPVETAPTLAALGPDGSMPSSLADPLIGQTIAKRFCIEARLGAGGMGTVYTAEQTAVGRKVVLKFLHASLSAETQLTERFSREALAVSQLTSPNTIVLHDFGQAEDGRLYMAMEYLEGRTLADLITASGAIPPLRAIAIALQILTSLVEAHEKGIVHRDLKPENIMLVNRGGTNDFVKVLDFGIAKILGDDEPRVSPVEAVRRRDAGLTQDSQLTQQGAIFGSPRYMSPEQALGETIAPQTDLYAVGVILYELLAGRPPFSGTNTLRLLHDHAHTPIKPLTEAFPDLALPEAVSDVVATCLQKDPKDRPASAQALVDDLHTTTRAVAIHQEAEERALLELVGITRRSSRGLFWGLGAVILLALVLVGVFLLGRSHGDDDGKALAPGDRLFVSAAGPTPSWAQADAPESQAALKVLKAGVAQVRGLKTRREALALAEVLAVTKRLDILLRFDAERETPSFLDDLRRISEDYQHAKTPLEVIGRYWVKLVEAQGNHKLATRYDAYVKVSPPASPEQRKALLRVLADRRFQNTSFLLDRAVNKRHCDRARALGARLRAAIDDLKVSKARKASMRGYLDTQQLARCK